MGEYGADISQDAYNEIKRMAVTAGIGAAIDGFRNYDWRQFFRGEHYDWNEYFNPNRPEDIRGLFMNRQGDELGRLPRVRY